MNRGQMVRERDGALLEETGTDPDGRDGMAVFRTGRHYRYQLLRDWSDGPEARRMTVIGCNPSKAGGWRNDHTVRRLCWYAGREGCSRLEVVNLFALVATNPDALLDVDDPVGGAANDEWIARAVLSADVVVLAWGNLPKGLGWRADDVLGNLDRMKLGRWRSLCFGRTGLGQPRHPSRLPNSAELVAW